MDDQVAMRVGTASATCRNSPSFSRERELRAPRRSGRAASPSTYSIANHGWPSAVTPPSSRRAMPGMLERREDLPLFREAAAQHAILIQPAAHHLERDVRGNSAVVARGEIHGAHAAAAEHVIDDVRSDARRRRRLALDEQRLRPRDRARVVRGLRVPRGHEQPLHRGAAMRHCPHTRVEIGGPRVRRQLERGVENGLDALPELCNDRACHACSGSHCDRQPHARLRPVATHRARRELQRERRLLLAHAAEEAAIDHAREPRVRVRERGERLVERDELLGAIIGCDLDVVELHAHLHAAALLRRALPRVVDEHAAHRHCRDREKFGASAIHRDAMARRAADTPRARAPWC